MRRLSLLCLALAIVGLSFTVAACDAGAGCVIACSGSPTSPGTAGVTSAAVVIQQFTASAATISQTAGSSLPSTSTLKWEVTPATALVRIDPQPGDVPTTGSQDVSPTATLTYTLTARAADGSLAQRSLTITVK